jgi:Cu(I)/Ag(I) efflux system membrane protein CusA/SilA
LGGIAIAIGVLVDAGIVMTENVLRHAEQHFEQYGEYRSKILEITLRGATLVGRPIFFSMAIIILAFVPVFALTGMEGKLFHPLAFTKTFAMIGSTIIAVTLVPVLLHLPYSRQTPPRSAQPYHATLAGDISPVLSFALNHRATTLLVAAGLFAFAVYLTTTIGSEFMPPLDEETAMWMPITDPSISLTKATELMVEQDRIIASDPAVKMVVGKIGRAETSTDPAPINMSETIITLTPKNTWPEGTTKDSILQRLDEQTAYSGCNKHLDATDSQSYRHVVNRRSNAGWREGVRERPACHRGKVCGDRARPARCPRRRRFVRREDHGCALC